MSNVKSIGSYLFKKVGPENLTLYQLHQAETEGLWADDTGPHSFLCNGPAHVTCIREAKAKLYLKTHFHQMMLYRTDKQTDTKWTQLVTSYL